MQPSPQPPERKTDAPPDPSVAAGEADPDNPLWMIRFSRLVQAHPEVFVGLYRDADRTPVAVFGAGADERTWLASLRETAGAQSFRTSRCDSTLAELQDVQAMVRDFSWPSGRRSFASFVDPRQCAVVVQLGSLTPEDTVAVRERFRSRVVIEEGSEPTRDVR